MDKLEAVGILSIVRATLVRDGCENEVTEKVIEALATACEVLTEAALKEGMGQTGGRLWRRG